MSEGQTRRGFLGGLLLGGVAGALGAVARAKALAPAPRKEVAVTTSFVHPYDVLARIAPRKKQLWVVSYVGQPFASGTPLDGNLADCEAALAGGADALILINENMPPGVAKTQFPPLSELEAAVKACRARYPALKLGVNWLGDEAEPYGYREGFRLARENGLSIVWTDYSGVDLIHENPPVDLHRIKAEKPADVFYCSGIHMKYSHLLDEKKTIEESALEAMGWVDGIIVTGEKTGAASDPEVVKRARRVIGRYPLGVASGVTAENVSSIRDAIDFAIVHTGIQEDHRIVASKVKALRAALDAGPSEGGR